ncbi:MAG: nucleotidyltransferase domain-containing protein [Nanoarchaeota archaeon]
MAELKKNLKHILKRYKQVADIIIFGSYVKGRKIPKDIDLAIMAKEKNLDLPRQIKKDIPWENVHLEFIRTGELYSNPLFISLLNEGYSIKEGAFIRDILGLSPKRLYKYDLKHLEQTKKVMFATAVNKILKKTGGEKIGNGAVLIPLSNASYFEDFLEIWGMKYKTREWTVI